MRPLRILALVKDPERRDTILALLQVADHHVVVVTDLMAAAESLRGSDFDTLLLELNTPGLDLTALRQAISDSGSAEPESLDEAERRHIVRVLRHAAGNKRQAALLLGISRSTLLNKVRKYGLEPH